MVKKLKNKLKLILTIVGWVIIVFAVVALITFIMKSGVLG